MNNQQNNTEKDSMNINSEYSELNADSTDSTNYVLPVEKSKHKHRQHRHFASSDNMTYEEKNKEADDYVFARPHNKHKKKRKGLKIFGIVMAVIAMLLVICVSTVFIFNQVGKSAMHNYDDMTIEPSPEIENVEQIENDGKTITYNGSTYSFNEKVTTVTLLGIDTQDSDDSTDRVVGEGGQADAIYIAVIDTAQNKVTILGVSRDIMVDVNVYNTSGGFVRTEPMQICLSYAYGDGAHTSCQNTIVSLERLFYGMQFDTYFSINENALKTLTDEVGGVTLTSSFDFYSSYYGRDIKSGETITLYGKDAEKYIRSRDLSELDSNNDRMARQRQFMTAFLEQVWSSVKSNPSVIVDLYSDISDNSTTNLTTSKMTYLATTAISGLDSYSEIEFVNLPGTITKGDYAEFYADQNSLMEIMLDLFYIQVS